MRFLEGIEWTLRTRGTALQRVLCAAMMAALTGAELPGGGYACQLAMFAVLLKRGLLVPAAFAGMMAGFVVSYGVGAVVCGKDEDDTQALAVLADKAAVCALHTAALGERAQLSRADIALQHLVYQQKYAKQKEAGK